MALPFFATPGGRKGETLEGLLKERARQLDRAKNRPTQKPADCGSRAAHHVGSSHKADLERALPDTRLSDASSQKLGRRPEKHAQKWLPSLRSKPPHNKGNALSISQVSEVNAAPCDGENAIEFLTALRLDGSQTSPPPSANRRRKSRSELDRAVVVVKFKKQDKGGCESQASCQTPHATQHGQAYGAGDRSHQLKSIPAQPPCPTLAPSQVRNFAAPSRNKDQHITDSAVPSPSPSPLLPPFTVPEMKVRRPQTPTVSKQPRPRTGIPLPMSQSEGHRLQHSPPLPRFRVFPPVYNNLYTAKPSPLVVPTSQFSATDLYHECAKLLVSPLGKEFVLDPTKLNSSALFFLPTIPLPGRGARRGQLNVLDIGGQSNDEYTLRLAAIPQIFLTKTVLRTPDSTEPSSPASTNGDFSSPGRTVRCSFRHQFPNLTMNDFTHLPFPDSSLAVISARSLYKGVRNTPAGPGEGLCWSGASAIDDLTLCLRECNRVLSVGGRLEFIFFERELSDCGPVTAEFQLFLSDLWCREQDSRWNVPSQTSRHNSARMGPKDKNNTTESNGRRSTTSRSGTSSDLSATDSERRGISAEEFVHVLKQAGFQGGRRTLTTFQLFTLNEIFDHQGNRRQTSLAQRARDECLLDAPTEAVPMRLEDVALQGEAQKLLNMIHQECLTRATGWKCVMGWASKPDLSVLSYSPEQN